MWHFQLEDLGMIRADLANIMGSAIVLCSSTLVEWKSAAVSIQAAFDSVLA
jgi:hypothetical protein